MFLRVRRPLRRLLAWAVLALYALPSGTALAAEVVHGVQHVAVAAAQARLQAEALGLGHARGLPPDVADAPLVHTHDGSTHAHGPWVAALDRAADTDESPDEPAASDGPTLSPHLATSGLASTAPALRAASSSPLRDLPSAGDGGPASPPPRG